MLLFYIWPVLFYYRWDINSFYSFELFLCFPFTFLLKFRYNIHMGIYISFQKNIFFFFSQNPVKMWLTTADKVHFILLKYLSQQRRIVVSFFVVGVLAWLCITIVYFSLQASQQVALNLKSFVLEQDLTSSIQPVMTHPAKGGSIFLSKQVTAVCRKHGRRRQIEFCLWWLLEEKKTHLFC